MISSLGFSFMTVFNDLCTFMMILEGVPSDAWAEYYLSNTNPERKRMQACMFVHVKTYNPRKTGYLC